MHGDKPCLQAGHAFAPPARHGATEAAVLGSYMAALLELASLHTKRPRSLPPVSKVPSSDPEHVDAQGSIALVPDTADGPQLDSQPDLCHAIAALTQSVQGPETKVLRVPRGAVVHSAQQVKVPTKPTQSALQHPLPALLSPLHAPPRHLQAPAASVCFDDERVAAIMAALFERKQDLQEAASLASFEVADSAAFTSAEHRALQINVQRLNSLAGIYNDEFYTSLRARLAAASLPTPAQPSSACKKDQGRARAAASASPGLSIRHSMDAAALARNQSQPGALEALDSSRLLDRHLSDYLRESRSSSQASGVLRSRSRLDRAGDGPTSLRRLRSSISAQHRVLGTSNSVRLTGSQRHHGRASRVERDSPPFGGFDSAPDAPLSVLSESASEASEIEHALEDCEHMTVTLQALSDFYRKHVQPREEADCAVLSTSQVVDQIIKPYTARHASKAGASASWFRAAEHEHRLLQEPAMFYVVHERSAPFRGLVAALEEHLLVTAAPTAARLWIDVFAINHHCPTADTSTFETVIRSESTLACLVVLDASYAAFSRLWCLYEMHLSLKRSCQHLQLLNSVNQRDLVRSLTRINVTKAECSDATAKAELLALIDAEFDSHFAFAHALQCNLVLAPLLPPPAPILLPRSAAPTTAPSRFPAKSLSALPPSLSVALRARPGPTESPVSAADFVRAHAEMASMYRLKSVLPEVPDADRATLTVVTGERATGKSTLAATLYESLCARANTDEQVCVLYHTVRRDDARHGDARHMLRSLGYQLSVGRRGAGKIGLHLAELLLGTEDADHRSVDTAALFKAMLDSQLAEKSELSVYIIIDGLDEADDVPSPVLLPSYGGPSRGGRQALPVLAGSNKILNLLCESFVTLPRSVHIVVTTTPSCAGGGALYNLKHAFGSNCFEVPIRQVFVKAVPESHMHLVSALHLMLPDAIKATLPKPPVHSAATTDDLHGVLAAIWEHEASERSRRVDEVVDVIIACMEPMHVHTYAALGYPFEVLRQLPGWGLLFFEHDGHLRIGHRCVCDWLTRPQAEHDTATRGNLARGHAILAQYFVSTLQMTGRLAQTYGLHHLCRAESCAELLTTTLENVPLLCRVLAGVGLHGVIDALAAVPYRHDLAEGWLRVLRRRGTEFAHEPERLTEVALQCPIGTAVYACARALESTGVRVALTLPRCAETWPADVLLLENVHEQGVTCVCWGPAGFQLVTGGGDGCMTIWAAATGAVRSRLSKHDAPVTVVKWSPSGKYVASADGTGSIRVHLVAAGACMTRFREPEDFGGATTLEWSPDSAYFAAGFGDSLVRLYHAEHGTRGPVFSGHQGKVCCISWCGACGSRLATGSVDRTVNVWDVTTGKRLSTLRGLSSCFATIAWRSDGAALVSGGFDASVRIWDLGTKATTHVFEEHIDTVTAVAWTADDAMVVSTSVDGTTRLWSVTPGGSRPGTQHCVAMLRGHVGPVHGLSVLADTPLALTVGADCSVRMWSLPDAVTQASMESHRDVVTGLVASPDAKSAASVAADGRLRCWNVTTGACEGSVLAHEGAAICVTWSSDRRFVATGGQDGSVALWCLSDGASESLQCRMARHKGAVTSVAFNPNAPWQLASASLDGTARVWHSALGVCTVTLRGHMRGVGALAWCPVSRTDAAGGDVATIATGGHDRWVIVWTVHTHRDLTMSQQVVTLDAHEDIVTAVRWSDGGARLVSASLDGTARIWVPPQKHCLMVVKAQHPLRSVSFLPGEDGLCVVVGCENGDIEFYDVVNGEHQQVLRLVGHTRAVSALLWMQGPAKYKWRRTLMSGSFDASLRVWRLALPTARRGPQSLLTVEESLQVL